MSQYGRLGKLVERRFLRILIPGLVLMAVVAFSIRSPRDPVARGESLSHWLEVLYSAEMSGEDEVGRTNAVEAIMEIGPAAVPVLLRKVSEKEGLRVWIARQWNRYLFRHAPEALGTRLQMDFLRVRRHRVQGCRGFKVLGTNAAGAVPTLREFLQDGALRSVAIRSLQAVHTDEALSALIPILSHPKAGVRQEALEAVLEFERRVVLAAEEIAHLTDDDNEGTAWMATGVAGDVLPAERAIPLLVRKFSDPRPRVAQAAVRSFTGRGPKAEPVMPAIAEVLKSPNELSRKLATNALLTINPSRAAEFGIDTNRISAGYYQIYHRTRQRLATNATPWRTW